MPSVHHTTQHENSRIGVMFGGLRRDTTEIGPCRERSGNAGYLRQSPVFVALRHLVDPQTSHDFPVGGCVVVSCDVG